MKKALIASTALVLTAGVAAADVTISGYGRTGVDYQESRDQETQVISRVRLNVLGTTSTDQGVDFGARLRLQWDQGDAGITSLAPGQIYVTASGLTVAVGNVTPAYDAVGLAGGPEIGYLDRSHGTRSGAFFGYASKAYGSNTLRNECDVDNPDQPCTIINENQTSNRLGIAAEYAVDALKARVSYVDPDQTSGATNEEISVSVDYTWNNILLAAAAVRDGAGIDGNDQYFLGAYYTLAGTENGVGLNWMDNGNSAAGVDFGKTIVLYGDYAVAPLTTVSAYIANNNADANETDNAFGIGASYDLGGARLSGAIERGYDENLRADMGVRFDF
ncbi:MAG: porin [Alphaproteobacteria bacterium]|nr:porin [Alphaproteobacteria bacterium]